MELMTAPLALCQMLKSAGRRGLACAVGSAPRLIGQLAASNLRRNSIHPTCIALIGLTSPSHDATQPPACADQQKLTTPTLASRTSRDFNRLDKTLPGYTGK
ncbi:hypothetical protein A7Q09_05525 [Methylacidiphilum sp. Yel]|nr:hypothetical protein A7Q09_05525 [Methylacidiphilum sp. Yel]